MSSRVAKEMYLSLIDYSMLFIHKKSRFVYNSGGHCPQQWRLHHSDQMLMRTAQKLIVTEGFYSVRKGSSRTLIITYYFVIKMCWKNVNSFDSM